MRIIGAAFHSKKIARRADTISLASRARSLRR